MADTITLKGMRFHALIGILPHEAHVRQPLEVDVMVDVDPVRTTRIVDYTALYRAVETVVAEAHVAYLEDAAEQIAEHVLMIDGVLVARVTVRKPHVALRGPLAYAEVAMTRSRPAE